MNTYGTKFRLTTFGESHGPAVGGIIDGCPSNIEICQEAIQADLARRRLGAPRQEEDEVEWLSGIKDGYTLGTPIAFIIKNKNTRTDDYANLVDCYRPGHADYTYRMKYGIRDHRGGGRASARETVARVVAGAIAKQLMPGISITTYVECGIRNEEVQTHSDNSSFSISHSSLNDTVGGVVSCCVTGVAAGIGDPIFNKLNASLAAAMMSIPSAIGFEMGAGFAAAQMSGSEYIDKWNSLTTQPPLLEREEKTSSTNSPLFTGEGAGVRPTQTNHCGGIQGGISNGMPIEFRVAFHPVVTIPKPVECLHEDGHLETVNIGGRHDRCHVRRAAVVVEAMTALCLANYLL